MNPKTKLIGTILLSVIFVSLISATVGYYYILPRKVDFNKYEDRIRSVFSRRIVYPSEFGELDIELTWNFRARVNADSVTIKKHNGEHFIKLGASYVEVPLLELLNKKVLLKKIKINTLDADITRSENGEFNISSIFAKVENPEYTVKMGDVDVNINGYRVKYIDNHIKPAQNNLFIGERLNVKYFASDKFIKVNAVGKAFLQDASNPDYNVLFTSALPFLETNKYHLSGSLTNVDLNSFNIYLKDKIALNGKGDINFDVEVYKKFFGRNKLFIDAALKDFQVETPGHGLISEYKEELNVFARGFYNDNLTVLDNFKISGNELDITGSGEVKKHDMNLKLRIKESQAQAISRLYPKLKQNTSFGKVLDKGIKAVVSGKLRIKGQPKKPDIYGNIEYSDLFLLNDTAWGSGRIDFVGSTFLMENKIYIDEESFVNVEGKINPFKDKFTDIRITSTDIDFNKAGRVLKTAQDFFKFGVGPVENMRFKGIGRVNLNISGKFNDTKINGYVEPKGLSVSYENLYKPAYNVRGKVVFVDKNVYYSDLTGFCDGMKISPIGYTALNGYSDVILHFPELDLVKGLNFVYRSPMLGVVKKALKDVRYVKGKADAKIKLKGKPENLVSEGEFLFKDSTIAYWGFGYPFEKVNGVLKYKEADIFFEGLTGYAHGNKAAITGFIDKNQDSELKVTSGSLDFNPAREFVLGSDILKKAADIVDDYTAVSGKSAIEIYIKGNLNRDPFQAAVFKNINGSFTHKLVGFPVSLSDGVITATSDKVIADNVQGTVLGSDYTVNGSMSNLKGYNLKKEPLVPDFNLDIKKFDFSKFLYFVDNEITPPYLTKFFKDFEEFHGFGVVEIKAEPDKWKLSILPVNVSALYKPYDTFFVFNKGKAIITNTGLKLSSLKGVVSQSSFEFDGFVDKKKFDLSANISINSADIDKARFYSDVPIIANGIIPLTLTLKGKSEDWNLFGKMVLEKGAYLSYLTDVGLPRDEIREVNIEASGTESQFNLKQLGVDMSDKNLVSIYGIIDKFNTKKPLFKDFVIKTGSDKPINTDILNPSIGCLLDNGCKTFFSKGMFKADIKLNGDVSLPDVFGNISFNDLMIPDFQTYIKNVTLDFQKDTAKFSVSGLTIGESVLNINAVMDNKLEFPLKVSNLSINTPLLNLDQIARILPKGSGHSTEDLPPIIITNGKIFAGEMIVRDLITNNIRASFNFTPDWLFSAPKISLMATNGVGEGSIFYNLKTSELSSSFNLQGMEANALATTLLSLPNEVYGTIDGSVQFKTRGKAQEELVANSNGIAKFTVTKGYFVRLGSLEYLLRAVNVLHSGVGGFNINNIIDLISPQKTGHFEILQGTVYAKNGVLYADDLTSAGKNLSLFITGNVDMLTNYSDIQVLGRLSKKVSGMLGPVGSVSINQFIDYIPGLGFLPTTPDRKGVIDLIPGLSKIPGLELTDDKKFRRFAVQIKGDLYDQSSVRSFRWIE